MTDVVLPPRHGLSLCAGGGGLDMGLGLAEPGFATSAFVEIEEYPRQCLIAAQAAGYFHSAPVWDDLKRFSGRPWRGQFDTLLAGYPCQPFSQAGQRRGKDDPRHLWPDIARIIDELGDGLRWCFFENVAGHVSLGLDTVLGDLRGLGFTPAAGLFTSAETGAAHERQRVFIVAYRDDGGGPAQQERRISNQRGRSIDGREAMDNPASTRRDGARLGAEANSGGSDNMAHANGRNARTEREQCGGEQRLHPAGGGTCGSNVGHPERIGWGKGRPEHELRSGRDTPSGAGGAMADTSGAGLERRERRGPPDQRNRTAASRSASEFRRPLLHAPGPADMGLWRFALDLAPDLAPALSLGDVASVADIAAQMVAAGHMAEAQAQSLVRRMAHGLAARSRALRLLGNGVHPLAAAHAWRTLSAAHGLRPVDLGGACGHAGGGADEPFWGVGT